MSDEPSKAPKAIAAAQQRSGEFHDQEAEHMEADAILCILLRELGYPEVSDAFEKIDKWYA